MEKNNSEIIIYQTEDGATKINVRLDGNSVWVTQTDLVELFQSSKSNISEHIKHGFEEGELNETAVICPLSLLGYLGSLDSEIPNNCPWRQKL